MDHYREHIRDVDYNNWPRGCVAPIPSSQLKVEMALLNQRPYDSRAHSRTVNSDLGWVKSRHVNNKRRDYYCATTRHGV